MTKPMTGSAQYFFVATTGRSGTKYLNNIFNNVDGCVAFHEPRPVCNGRPMRRFALGSDSAMRAMTRRKIDNILKAKQAARFYAETNHCFIKGFGWHVTEFLPEDQIGVIIVKRAEHAVARSLFRVGCSPLWPSGRRWLTLPTKKQPLVPPPRRMGSAKTTYNLAFLYSNALRGMKLACKIFRLPFPVRPKWLINYELECLHWYVKETAAETALFRRKYPHIQYYEVDIEDMNSVEKVKKMLDHYGLALRRPIEYVVGEPMNQKLHKPDRLKLL